MERWTPFSPSSGCGGKSKASGDSSPGSRASFRLRRPQPPPPNNDGFPMLKIPGRGHRGATSLLCILASSQLLGAEPAITNSLGMKFVPIEPGSFLMGQDGPTADYNVKAHAAKFDDADWDEKPAHRVRIV